MIFYHDIDPVLFELGPLEVRWYGVMFVVGLLLNYLLMRWLFKKRKFKLEDLDSLVLWLFVGMVAGARLGHVFFYNASYFLERPFEILQIWHGGLSSHGAAIGVLAAFLMWSWIKKIPFSKYVDVMVLGMPITSGFVRIGNFFNSEILGRATDGTWGVIFGKLGEKVPRCPSQLYEAGISFVIAGILIWMYLKAWKKVPKFFFMFLYVGLYFSTRFLVEFWKERHVLTDGEWLLSMGQILSVVPAVIAMAWFVWALKKSLTR